MRRGITVAVLIVAMMLFLRVCSGSGQAQDTDGNQAGDARNSQAGDTEGNQAGMENITSEQMKEAAEGTTVTLYSWGGDERLDQWLGDESARVMKEKYDVTMERVPIDIDQVLSQLTGKVQVGGEDGSIDVIQVSGENSRSAEESNILYGPFTDRLPNFNDYVDGDSRDVTIGLAYPIEGYEAPYGKTQLVMVADLIVTPDVPESTGALRGLVERYPGEVTYPAPPDFMGSTFARNIIYKICSYEQFMGMGEGRGAIRAAVASAMKYLRELNPYSQNQGAASPDSSATMDSMFVDGELVVNITCGAYGVTLSVEGGKYTDTVTTFQFDKGATGSADFITIAADSGSKVGTMMAVNEMMSPEIQTDHYRKPGIISVLDNEKLFSEQRATFDWMDPGKGIIPQGELLSERLPGMPAQLVPIIEEIWTEEVVDK